VAALLTAICEPPEATIEIVRSVGALRSIVAGWRAAGRQVALVPTMGALHDGHLSLVRLAQRHAARVIATIFVNPTQFGAGEDLTAYPRQEAADVALLGGVGCDLLFAPTAAEMYPAGFATQVRVGGLTDVLCGAARPGHFDGVAQVVTKYLNQAQADVAVFGEKDWQQLAVIRRLATDLDIPTRIIGGPTIREGDGLAMSSRNRYLSEAERSVAPTLHRALSTAAQAIAEGQSAHAATDTARRTLRQAGFAQVDYLEARHAATLAPFEAGEAGPARIFGAAVLGRARLIDNVPIPEGR
jgi:pantoate--beta-alanine ligase